MILKLSWRNIWRNPTRSLVVIGAIVIGVWSVIFLLGMVYGMAKSYVDNAIQKETSHIQIHHPHFPDEKESKYYLEEPDQILEQIQTLPSVRATTIRSLSNAMIGSSRGNRGIKVNGIIPEREKDVTGMGEAMVEGEYLDESGKNHILLSTSLAEKLKVRLRSKVVLTFQTVEGEIISGAFRVNGLFDTNNEMYDNAVAFVHINALNRLLGKQDIGHEALIYLDNIEHLDTAMTRLKSMFPDLLVQSYKEISPEMELFEEQIGMAGRVYMVIFMLALIFGIINTMLMAVLERVRELGMLMAVGMNKLKVFFMIVFETIMLGFVGAPVGILFGWLMTIYFNKTGINLVMFAEEGMQQFGMSSFIYPEVATQEYFVLAFAVFITALLASLYPAYKAIRLKPVEAIRKL
jgi:ABC-type lipoprotein release transport system permease subunit